MPVPTPRKSEKKADFISRCIQFLSDEDTGREQSQIEGICYSQWENQDKSKMMDPPSSEGLKNHGIVDGEKIT